MYMSLEGPWVWAIRYNDQIIAFVRGFSVIYNHIYTLRITAPTPRNKILSFRCVTQLPDWSFHVLKYLFDGQPAPNFT